MRNRRGRAGTLTLLMFILSLALFPPTSSAQSDVYYPDYGNNGGGGSAQGGGSCTYCDQPQCGCYSYSTMQLIQWVCACDNSQPHGVCYQACWYESD